MFLIFGLVFAQQTGARYLIITHDNFYNTIKPLVEWKNRTGMKCRIAKLSQIGSTADAIRNYMLNAYNTWQIKPEFLLLVGAPNYLPLPQVSGTYSDNYYTNMNGDIYNEILSGRLTVHDTLEAKTVVNKILLYERFPATSDPTWFKKGTVIVNVDNDPADDSIYWSDAKHAAGLMVANGFTSIDTLSDMYGHDATFIIDVVNRGRSYVLYRGSGVSNWYSPFNCDPALTENGSKLPIVLSITCQTIGTGSTPAAAEYWLLTGTPTLPRGAAGYFATTTVVTGGAQLRSAVAKGFFDAAFGNHKRTFGEACEGGRIRVYSLYPTDAHEYYGYTTLGDPEMGLWTDTPCSLAVNHPLTIPILNASFSVFVTRAASGTPVSGAFVCVMGKEDTILYAVDTTDATGYTSFTVHPQIFYDTIFVTVSGQNLKPYEGFMVVSSNGAYIQYHRSRINDSLSGNGDLVINPGETINLPVWIRNVGSATASDIYGMLQCSDTMLSMIDSVKHFGDIASLDSAYSGDEGYYFIIDPRCPDNHQLNFQLVCWDSYDSTWASYFSQTVRSANLLFIGTSISGGNGNSIFEPGETVTVKVSLRNTGSVGLNNVAALLSTNSNDAGIIDSQGTYARIGPDSVVSNVSDPFIIYADPGIPPATYIPFQLALSAGYYQDTINFTLIVGRRDYYIWNPDPTPAPGEAIHSILQTLGYGGETGLYLPSDLNMYTALFVCTGIYPNNRIIANNSTEGAEIRDYLINHQGRVYLEGGDVWYYDPRYNSGYRFDTLFGLRATADGNPDLGPVVGQTGTFTQAMNFGYGGENGWIDHISAAEGFLIFKDGDNNYDCSVAYDPGSYRTVGISFELGGLVDGPPPSTRSVLLDSIMRFFGIRLIGVREGAVPAGETRPVFSAYPTLFRQRLCFHVRTAEFMTGILKIYDLAGRVRKTVFNEISIGAGIREYVWDGTDDHKNRVAEGVYFARLETGGFIKTIKIIYLR